MIDLIVETKDGKKDLRYIENVSMAKVVIIEEDPYVYVEDEHAGSPCRMFNLRTRKLKEVRFGTRVEVAESCTIKIVRKNEC